MSQQHQTAYADPRDATDGGRMPYLDEQPAYSPPAVAGQHQGAVAPAPLGRTPGQVHGGDDAQRIVAPRDIPRVLQQIRTEAAIAGERWVYSYPAKDPDTKRMVDIYGLSIKGAMAVSRIYGNCTVDCRVDDPGGEHWTLYALFEDFETGYRLVRPLQHYKGHAALKASSQKAGGLKRAEERNLRHGFSAGVSIAQRNVITNALDIYCEEALEEARNALAEKVGKNLAAYKERVKSRLAEIDVDLKRVERTVGRPIEEWAARHTAKVITEIQAVTGGMAMADDIWPPLEPPKAPAKERSTAMDAFAGGKDRQQDRQQPGDGGEAAPEAGERQETDTAEGTEQQDRTSEEAQAEQVDPETGELLDGDDRADGGEASGEYDPSRWPAAPEHVKKAADDTGPQGWPRVVQWLKTHGLPECPPDQRQHLVDFYADSLARARNASATQAKMIDGILEANGVSMPERRGG